VLTPGQRSVEEVTRFLSIAPRQLVKTMILKADSEVVAALVRGDHELNEAKLKSFLGVQTVELADAEVVAHTTDAPMGFAGPLGLKTRIVADVAVREMVNFVTGGNREDLHLKNVNLDRDFKVDRFGDIRVITVDDPCPRCGGGVLFNRGIEVGHIFKLGTKYSDALRALYLDSGGKDRPIVMGCYGIGVGRTAAAAIEQNHDQGGIIWPIPIAPFEVVVLPLQMHESAVVETAEKLYAQLRDHGIDVLLDDRDERAGIKFNDADLIGFPIRVTVGIKSVRKGELEIKRRLDSHTSGAPIADAAETVKAWVRALYDSIA
jgi:prolyl-tRNA synthetase